MANSERNKEESVGSQREDHFVNLERRRDKENNPTPSVRVEIQHIEHTRRSYSKSGSYVSYEQETRNLRLEIDHLHKKLRRRERSRRNLTPPSRERSEERKDRPYWRNSRTPTSESFSASSEEDKFEERRKECGKGKQGENLFPQTIGNDAMSKALRQISKSPFVRRIDRAKLPPPLYAAHIHHL